MGFVDLENAYDTVPREMVMATVRWTGVPKAEARMVEAMYERTKGRVVVVSGLSEEFPVNIGLRQGSALSPLLVIMVMEIISRKISMKDILRKMMYADDLAIIAESKQELQEVLEERKKHGKAWTENEPRKDRNDVGWTPERGVEHQVGWLRDQASAWLCVPWRNGYGGWAFSGRGAKSDTSGSECLEKERESCWTEKFQKT